MKWTESYHFTLKNDPADAEIPSHKLLVRAGFMRKLGQGVYVYGPMLLRSIRKFESIIREELDKVGCMEMLMPMVHPGELWKETGRWQAMGNLLLKFKNRLDQEWCLGATHEEVVTDYIRGDVKSYRDLPFSLYQIQTKYRDEIRPRFGLMRGREFIMKDAYSFDRDKESAIASYDKLHDAYVAIFSRLGLEFRVVQADSGAIGGDKSQEFHVLAESGEDHLLVSSEGDYAANVEICPVQKTSTQQSSEKDLPLEEFATPGLRTIEELATATGLSQERLVKTMFYNGAEPGEKFNPIAVILRGSDEVNPIKVKNLLGLSADPELLNDKEVKELTGADPGSCGPVGLDIPVYADFGVEAYSNFIVGANKDDVHFKNVNSGRDFKVKEYADLRLAQEGDPSPVGKGVLKSYRGIEVGHIFYLGTKYSKAMGASYLSPEGKPQPIEMGCYGIGVTRTVQAAIEQCHDQDGMMWPVSLAPYEVHICLLDPKDEKASQLSAKLCDGLREVGFSTFVDDRKERPGVKFKDADLMGMPLRVTIGARGLQNNEVEIVERMTKTKHSIAIDKSFEFIKNWLEEQKSK